MGETNEFPPDVERERRFEQAERILADHFAAHGDEQELDIEGLCTQYEHLAAELRELHDRTLRLQSALREKAPEPWPGSPWITELLERLERRSENFRDYAERGRIDGGGMGEIHSVHDRVLGRELAMKVLRGGAAPTHRALARFLREARVTALLDHPGIAPVHELGIDPRGRVYFTMKRVRGSNFEQILELVFERRHGWNEMRAVGVINKACEAVAYAHQKKVVHRDLKPANIMVGDFGAVYVMDWGLAKASHLSEDVDPLPAAADQPSHADSASLTLDGEAPGTPAYMAPEQARGELAAVGPHSDVYSAGALLYHLLAQKAPYARDRDSWDAVRARVIAAPPEPLSCVAPNADPELVSVCEHAMARDPRDRYAGMRQMTEDLRAWLEGRVVGAHESGPWAELRKWVLRNRALAVAIAAAVLILVVAASLIGYHEARADRKSTEARLLSAMQQLDGLETEAHELWPAAPPRVERYEDWIGRAQFLVGQRDEIRFKLAELGSRGGEENTADVWWQSELDRLLARLDALAEPRDGLLSSGVSGQHGWAIPKRLEFARTVEERTVLGAEARARWAEALASIRDLGECPAYAGLELTPQLGLLPIGRDPESGLWEFSHLQTGEPAERGSDGRLSRDASTGLVFVLLPGGTFRMGAQSRDPDQPNHYERAEPDEFPVHEVTLEPFFLSKYEMNQGQWEGSTGKTPSNFVASPLHPVEQVTWEDCDVVVRHLGLLLPTEAQWEYAARAGSSTPWCTGADPKSLAGSANLADLIYAERQLGRSIDPSDPNVPQSWRFELWLNDGYASHAPVGSYAGNGFGLRDVYGNVWEWCRDWSRRYDTPPLPNDGLRGVGGSYRIARGGSYHDAAILARSAYRDEQAPGYHSRTHGVRPALGVAR